MGDPVTGKNIIDNVSLAVPDSLEQPETQTTFEVEVPETPKEPVYTSEAPSDYAERRAADAELEQFGDLSQGKTISEIMPKEVVEPLTTEINPEDVETLTERPSFTERVKSLVSHHDVKSDELSDYSYPEEPSKPKEEPITTTIKDEFPKEDKSKKPGFTESVKKHLTFERAKQSLFGSEDEHARLGGYIGKRKEVLQSEIDRLSEYNNEHRGQLKDLKKELTIIKDELQDLEDKPKRTEEEKERLSILKGRYREKKAEFESLKDEINENSKKIDKNREDIEKYNKAINEGKRKSSITRSVREEGVKKVRKVGEGAYGVTSGTEKISMPELKAGIRTKAPWFGPGGFIEHPHTKMTGVIEPVRGGSSRLYSYTRETGRSVKGGIGEALVTVRAGRILSPMGVPERSPITGQFQHTVPARKIPLSSLNRASINPAILPNIYDVPENRIPVPTTEYKPVLQPDGSVVNVPVTNVQERKSKLYPVKVNRYEHIKLHMPKQSRSIPGIEKMVVHKQDPMLLRGVKSVGKLASLKSITIDTKEMKHPKTIKTLKMSKKQTIDIGLIDSNNNGMVILPDKPIERVSYRKQKKTSALVDLNVSKRISKNIKKVVSQHNKKY